MAKPWWQYYGNQRRIVENYLRKPDEKNRGLLIAALESMSRADKEEPASFIFNDKEHINKWIRFFHEKGDGFGGGGRVTAILMRLRQLSYIHPKG